MESTQRPAAEKPRGPVLELITKEGCHLCEDARVVVKDVAQAVGVAWTEVRLESNPELIQRYGEEIPVVLVDGVQRDFWHIDPVRLESILRRSLGE